MLKKNLKSNRSIPKRQFMTIQCPKCSKAFLLGEEKSIGESLNKSLVTIDLTDAIYKLYHYQFVNTGNMEYF